MTEWIKIVDRLPQELEYCWVCDNENDILDAVFLSRCPENNGGPCFCLDRETGNYVIIEEVTHWMPYFTPEPPMTK